MNKPVALFDIGGTMFPSGSDIGLIDAHIQDGLMSGDVRDQVEDILGNYGDQSLPYEAMVRKLMSTYASGLKDISVDRLQASTDQFFEQPDFFGYVEPTIEFLSPTHEVVLVTGSSQFTAGAIAKFFNVNKILSTKLEVSSGALTGEVDSYLATRDEKTKAISELDLDGSFGFGDSEGDIGLLRAVDFAVCIQPTAGLAEIANQEKWAIVNSQEDLAAKNGLHIVRLALADHNNSTVVHNSIEI